MANSEIFPVIIRKLDRVSPDKYTDIFGVMIKRSGTGYTYKINESNKAYGLFETVKKICHLIDFTTMLCIAKKETRYEYSADGR